MIFSFDLRERVVAAVKNKMHINEAARLFKINQRTIYKWIKLEKETGSFVAKTGYQKGHSHKITDWDLFKNFAYLYKNYTTEKMAIKWTEETGIQVSESTILKALHKIGFTFKKKHFSTKKQMLKKELYF